MVAEYYSVYDELAYFLASLSPRKVLQYKASQQAQERVNLLQFKNQNGGLNAEENAEMERYMTLEHIIRLAKSKAMQQLNTK
jgi:hypothetical protein